MRDTFVVDCSVAAKWILPEPDRAAALTWFERYTSGEIALIAPDLLLAEFASLLSKRSRRKEISPLQCRQAFALMTRCAPRLVNTRPRISRALDLSLQFQLSLWDCAYVALALEYDCPVLTSDRRLLRGGERHANFRFVE